MATEDNAAPEANQGSDNTNAPPPVPPQNEQVLPNAEENPPDKHIHVNVPGKHWTVDWLPIVINGALAIIGAIAIYVYGAQLRVMRGQLTAMNNQLVEMQRQTNLAQEQLEGTVAANVVLTTPELSNRGLEISIYNEGHVSAPHVHLTVKITRQNFPGLRTLGKPETHFKDIPPIPAASGGYGNSSAWKTVYPIKPLSESETVTVEQTLDFENGFQHWFRAENCLTYIDHYNVFTVKGGPGGPDFRSCQEVRGEISEWEQSQKKAN